MRMALALTPLVLAANVAVAQRLAGVVKESASGVPISGAVVSIVDAKGASVARTVTDRAGAFRLPVDSLGRVVQVRRIGFRPRDVPLPDSARTATATITLEVERLPLVLDPVKVVSDNCPKYKGTSAALALWEQARLGFLAAVVARDAAPVDTRMLVFSRVMKGREVAFQNVESRGGASFRPVRAGRPPDDFAKSGYSVVYSGFGLVYEGPDADVLLDESFRETHCFDLASESPDRPGQVGIEFEPRPNGAQNPQRRTTTVGRGVRVTPPAGGAPPGFVDIKGTLWLDKEPLQLRSLDFEYVGRSVPLTRPAYGGDLTFRSVENGVVIIQSWSMRTPSAGTARVTGSEVIRARWPDGTGFERLIARLDGVVIEKGTGRPVSGLRVRLTNTPFQTHTDSDGRFSFPDLVEGPYVIVAADSSYALRGFGRAANDELKLVAGKPTAVRLTIDARPTPVKSSCKDGSFGEGADAVVARMVDAFGLPLKGRIGATIAATDSSRSTTRSVDAASGGWVKFCGIVEGTVRLEGVDLTGRRGKLEIKTSGLGMLDSVTIRIGPGG